SDFARAMVRIVAGSAVASTANGLDRHGAGRGAFARLCPAPHSADDDGAETRYPEAAHMRGGNVIMTPDRTDEAAAILLSNWKAVTRIDALPEACRPGDRAEGYAVAAAFARQS